MDAEAIAQEVASLLDKRDTYVGWANARAHGREVIVTLVDPMLDLKHSFTLVVTQ